MENSWAEGCNWQNCLARLGILVSIVGAICILVVVILTLVQPDGGDSLGVTVATVLAMLATVAIQLLIAGVLVERETLSPRLPKVTLGRLLLGAVAVLIIFPLMSFAFGFGIIALCIFGLFWFPNPVIHLRGIAVCNAILCLGVSEVMRRTCGWDDGGVSRAVLAIYALGATLLAGLFLLSSIFRMPLITKFLFCMFLLAALHATSILLSGISTLLSRNLEDASVDFGTDYCIESTIRSALSAVIKAFRDSYRDEGDFTPRPTTTPPPDPCAGYLAQKWPEPSDAGIWAGIVFSLGGVWMVVVNLAMLIFHPGVKVSPEATGRRRSSRQNSKPKLTKQATKEALNRQRAKCIACCRAFVSSMERLICLLVLIGAAGGLVLMGYLKLKDSFESESRRLTDHAMVTNTTGEVDCASLYGPPPDEPLKRPVYDGILAWAHVPADRMAVVWCDYGELAAICVGALMYCSHILACSMTLKRISAYAVEDRRNAFNQRIAEQIRRRTKSKDSRGTSTTGSSANLDDQPGMEQGFHLAYMQPRDPLPEKKWQDMDGRVFDV
mmetsp:Transcript_46372/g.87040  ORF Transcript_46372/g.87040 Transcript_46372/m.87040 type:complete len:554 (+) Transcript_46372:104-1765(+)